MVTVITVQVVITDLASNELDKKHKLLIKLINLLFLATHVCAKKNALTGMTEEVFETELQPQHEIGGRVRKLI